MEEVVRFVSMRVAGGSTVSPQASVKVEARGLTLEFEGEGDGMVHATFDALKKAFGIAAQLVDYRVVPITKGADAMAEINVVVRIGGEIYSGRSVSTDVVEGSARAFVHALNRAARTVISDTVMENL
jgi:2-isopropylmalate synthase